MVAGKEEGGGESAVNVRERMKGERRGEREMIEGEVSVKYVVVRDRETW